MIKNPTRLFSLAALLLVHMVAAVSQDSKLRIAGMSGDSVDCGVYLSGYREFYKYKYYDFAKEPWLIAFDNCPGTSLRMYVDGAALYRIFIEETPEGPVREGLIDTLLLIYDRRMENFGDEGNVLGRKGRDLLTYRNTDIDQVQNAYELLERSIEIEGTKSQESVMLLLLRAGIVLNKEDKLDETELIDNYIMLSGMLDQMEKRSTRWKRTRAAVDEMVLKKDIFSCEALDQYHAIHFEERKMDKNYLEASVALFKASACNRSDFYVEASENLYSIDPDPESAHELGILFISMNENEKAADFLKEAVQGDNIDTETRAKWYYELSLVSLAIEDHCGAIQYAREAVKLKEDFSAAYILLGDAFIASRNNLGDDFQKRTAYWAAADQYRKAAMADPSLESETRQKMNDSRGQYPNSEDVFFRDLKEGDTYLVEGCINESTTVQARQ
jgi:hypothetical protein